jgi:hypothetical protein
MGGSCIRPTSSVNPHQGGERICSLPALSVESMDIAARNGYLLYGGRMKYWSNVLAMAGAACIAVAFIEGRLYVFSCGLLLAYTGYKLWRVR